MELALLVILVLSLFILWIYRLKKEINKRVIVEKKLKESEERFRILFEISPILINSFDSNYKCLFWNKECERVFGWSKEELNEHNNVLSLFYPDAEDQLDIKNSFNKIENIVFKEWHPITKQKEKLVTLWANVILPNLEIINIGIDITQQRKAQEELLKAQEELKQFNSSLQDLVDIAVLEIQKKEQILLEQSKLAQMGEMISMIAHQWRQPLSVIDISAFSISNKINLGKFDLNDKQSQEDFLLFIESKIQNIHKHIQYLTATIEDFTNFFKPYKDKEEVSPLEAVTKAISILQTTIENENILLNISCDSDSKINIHLYEMMQAVMNIIKNSIDNFIEKSIVERKIDINITQENEKFIIKISDNGSGIDEGIIGNIFDPYFSTKSEKNGTGLGLYISKVVIEKYSSGLLEVANTNDGVCFKITLFGDK